MGRDARLNPRSPDGQKPERAVHLARLSRFAESFARREDYEAYLVAANVNAAERAFLDSVLPERLREVEH